MNREQIQDLAILHANEGLDTEHKIIYDAWIISAEDEAKQIFSDTLDICADISFNVTDHNEIKISNSVKNKIFTEIKQTTKKQDVLLIREEEQDWINLPVKGAKWLELSARKQDGFVMSMIEIEPGCELPEHDHHGVEMAYILEGDLEADGNLLHAGDFFRADAGTHHGVNISPSGCRALVVTSNKNYNHTAMKTLGTVQKAYRKIKNIFAKT